MGCANWRVTNVFSTSEVNKKKTKGLSDNLFGKKHNF
jgi:hypothetical protein